MRQVPWGNRTQGGEEAEERSGQACAEHLGWHNLHTLPNAQHMSLLQKALGKRVVSASQWACCVRVSDTLNDDKVVHQ